MRRHETGGRGHAAAAAHGLEVQPTMGTALVICMDSRIDTFALFGLENGEIHVLRNAGGVVTDDVVRSLAISQRKLDTRDVVVVQHTGCGMTSFTDDEFADELAAETGIRPPWRTHAFDDPAVSVRRDLARLRSDPFLHRDMTVRGFVLDIESFGLVEVDPRVSV